MKKSKANKKEIERTIIISNNLPSQLKQMNQMIWKLMVKKFL